MMQGTLNIGCMKCRQPIGIVTFHTVVPGQFIFYCAPCWQDINNVTPEEAIDALLDEMNHRKQQKSLNDSYGSPWHT